MFLVLKLPTEHHTPSPSSPSPRPLESWHLRAAAVSGRYPDPNRERLLGCQPRSRPASARHRECRDPPWNWCKKPPASRMVAKNSVELMQITPCQPAPLKKKRLQSVMSLLFRKPPIKYRAKTTTLRQNVRRDALKECQKMSQKDCQEDCQKRAEKECQK